MNFPFNSISLSPHISNCQSKKSKFKINSKKAYNIKGRIMEVQKENQILFNKMYHTLTNHTKQFFMNHYQKDFIYSKNKLTFYNRRSKSISFNKRVKIKSNNQNQQKLFNPNLSNDFSKRQPILLEKTKTQRIQKKRSRIIIRNKKPLLGNFEFDKLRTVRMVSNFQVNRNTLASPTNLHFSKILNKEECPKNVRKKNDSCSKNKLIRNLNISNESINLENSKNITINPFKVSKQKRKHSMSLMKIDNNKNFINSRSKSPLNIKTLVSKHIKKINEVLYIISVYVRGNQSMQIRLENLIGDKKFKVVISKEKKRILDKRFNNNYSLLIENIKLEGNKIYFTSSPKSVNRRSFESSSYILKT